MFPYPVHKFLAPERSRNKVHGAQAQRLQAFLQAVEAAVSATNLPAWLDLLSVNANKDEPRFFFQSMVPDAMRGRVMALWIMVFGGTVPLGVLVAGPFAKSWSPEVLLIGAAWSLVLAFLSSARLLRAKGAPDD